MKAKAQFSLTAYANISQLRLSRARHSKVLKAQKNIWASSVTRKLNNNRAMKTNDCEILKINFLKVTTDDDFELRASFYRFCDVLESIRLQTFSSVKNKIKPIKIKDCDDIFFMIGRKINIEFKVKEQCGKYALYILSNNAFKRFEKTIY